MKTYTLVFIIAMFAMGAAAEELPYDDYGQVLETYVDDFGMVNYSGLQNDRAKLDNFIDAVAELDQAAYDNFSENNQLAFWINVYNAQTLKIIIDNYPIQPTYIISGKYPNNSIQQIRGVFNKLKFKVMGKDMTLDHIEHKILRKKFNEPRIHMAIVCASISCPPLRKEVFRGDMLDMQLADQSEKFLADRQKFMVGKRFGKVYLSMIFKWFGGDFESYADGKDKLKGQSRKMSGVLYFIADQNIDQDKEFLLNEKYEITYLQYDWSLNDQ